MIQKTTTYATADEMIAQFRKAGWLSGTPRNYGRAARCVDVCVTKRLVCPNCGRKGLCPYFLHKAGRLRIIAQCPSCGCGDER